VRKHLLEYDDVLNQQRAQIYGQRDRIFVKEDLSDNIAEMLEEEVRQRVETGLVDPEGPWKLIAWLEQVQPPFMTGERLFPSFGLSLLLKELNQSSDSSTGAEQALRQSTLDLITRAIDAENAHHFRAVENLIETTEQSFELQLSSREDSLDAYFEGLRDMDDTERPPRECRPQRLPSTVSPRLLPDQGDGLSSSPNPSFLSVLFRYNYTSDRYTNRSTLGHLSSRPVAEWS
jgi:preprotein translocase subunit SecA